MASRSTVLGFFFFDIGFTLQHRFERRCPGVLVYSTSLVRRNAIFYREVRHFALSISIPKLSARRSILISRQLLPLLDCCKLCRGLLGLLSS